MAGTGSRIRSHRDLIVWQKLMDLTELMYGMVRAFPSEERFRLSDQLIRAAVSVPANIAEGFAQGSAKDYARFLAIAKGSLMERETYVQLARRVGYIPLDQEEKSLELIAEISRMLTSLRSKILSNHS